MKIGPKFKICRRLGDRVFPKAQTTKFSVSGTEKKRRGKRGHRAPSAYGLQLIEKQKGRYSYCLTEKQFSNYVKKARLAKVGTHAEKLFDLLETRLDNVLYRLGLAASRLAGRQTASHGHVLVNGRRVTIPSYQIKVGDKITIRPQDRDRGVFKDLAEKLKGQIVPNWLVFDLAKGEGTMLALPKLSAGESTLNFDTIFEYYSRI